jgi:hypothetical protein
MTYAGSFRARDGLGRVYWITRSVHAGSAPPGEGSKAAEPNPTFETADGTPVQRTAKGEYALLHPLGRPITLRSADPNAP